MTPLDVAIIYVLIASHALQGRGLCRGQQQEQAPLGRGGSGEEEPQLTAAEEPPPPCRVAVLCRVVVLMGGAVRLLFRPGLESPAAVTLEKVLLWVTPASQIP